MSTSLRVAIGGLHTETNTFSPVPAEFGQPDQTRMARGEYMVSRYADSHHTLGGFLRICADEGVEVVPLVYANAMACGTLPAEAFERVVAELVQGLKERGPFDAVLLAQHGAAVSDGHLDADAELAERVRDAVGADVALGMALDLHGNVNERMVRTVDVAVGYRENPHRDAAIRGAECARLTLRTARGEIRPTWSLVQLPMVVPILGGWTGAGTMRAVMSEAERISGERALLSYSVFHGFGYADVPQMGSSVLAVSDGDPAAAREAAREIAGSLWNHREGLRGEAIAPAAAIEEVGRHSTDDGPIVLLDVGDNVGGGAPGDSTVLLAEALQRRVAGVVGLICDAAAVQRALATSEGGETELSLGATTSSSVGGRLRVRGRVAKTSDGRFEDSGQIHGGFRFQDCGPTVQFSTEGGQELLISSRPLPSFSPEQLRMVGIEPRDQRAIVAKGVVAPRAGYESVASEFLLVDTPGVTAADLSGFSYQRRRRPLWPLESPVWAREQRVG